MKYSHLHVVSPVIQHRKMQLPHEADINMTTVGIFVQRRIGKNQELFQIRMLSCYTNSTGLIPERLTRSLIITRRKQVLVRWTQLNYMSRCWWPHGRRTGNPTPKTPIVTEIIALRASNAGRKSKISYVFLQMIYIYNLAK